MLAYLVTSFCISLFCVFRRTGPPPLPLLAPLCPLYPSVAPSPAAGAVLLSLVLHLAQFGSITFSHLALPALPTPCMKGPAVWNHGRQLSLPCHNLFVAIGFNQIVGESVLTLHRHHWYPFSKHISPSDLLLELDFSLRSGEMKMKWG